MARQTEINEISPEQIDITYPVAGQDNDSQGFRDNFRAIKDATVITKTELLYIDSNTAKTNENNNFGGNEIANALLINNYEAVNNIGPIASGVTVSYLEGSYHKYTISENITLTLDNWPSADDTYAKMRVELLGDGSSRTVTFAAGSGGTILKESNFPDPLTVQSTTVKRVFEFWTSDGGQTVLARDLGSYS